MDATVAELLLGFLPSPRECAALSCVNTSASTASWANFCEAASRWDAPPAGTPPLTARRAALLVHAVHGARCDARSRRAGARAAFTFGLACALEGGAAAAVASGALGALACAVAGGGERGAASISERSDWRFEECCAWALARALGAANAAASIAARPSPSLSRAQQTAIAAASSVLDPGLGCAAACVASLTGAAAPSRPAAAPSARKRRRSGRSVRESGVAAAADGEAGARLRRQQCRVLCECFEGTLWIAVPGFASDAQYVRLSTAVGASNALEGVLAFCRSKVDARGSATLRTFVLTLASQRERERVADALVGALVEAPRRRASAAPAASRERANPAAFHTLAVVARALPNELFRAGGVAACARALAVAAPADDGGPAPLLLPRDGDAAWTVVGDACEALGAIARKSALRRAGSRQVDLQAAVLAAAPPRLFLRALRPSRTASAPRRSAGDRAAAALTDLGAGSDANRALLVAAGAVPALVAAVVARRAAPGRASRAFAEDEDRALLDALADVAGARDAKAALEAAFATGAAPPLTSSAARRDSLLSGVAAEGDSESDYSEDSDAADDDDDDDENSSDSDEDSSDDDSEGDFADP